MAKRKPKRIRWPMAGVDRRQSFQGQPPYTTPEAQNVRPTATFEGRERGGSRPGFEKSHTTQLGSGADVNMLESVTYTRQDMFTEWIDEFPGTSLGSVWAAASWTEGIPGVIDETLTSASETNQHVGAVRSAISDFDSTSAYWVGIYIVPYEGEHHGDYHVYARMDDTTPVATTDGIVATLRLTGSTGTFSGNLYHYAASVKTTYAFTGGSNGYAAPGWFVVYVNSNTITCYWRGATLKAQAVAAATGERIGFGMECTEMDGLCLTDTFRLQYTGTTAMESKFPLLVAAAGGTLYKEGAGDTWTEVTSDLTINDDREIHGVEAFQKLYIADYGDYLTEQTDGVIGGASYTELTSASIADWTALSIDTDDDVVVVSDGTPDTVKGVYAISAVAAAKLTFTATAGVAATGCTFRVERGPKVYDPSANTLALLAATAGALGVPVGCPCSCLYRGRLVFAGNMADPHMWWMSKQDTLTDYNYEATDAGRAVAGTSADAGKLGEPCIAVISHNDDLCLFGCTNSLWVLRGDATYGGQLQNLSHEVGIVDKGAWAYTPWGELLFLSRDGLYSLAAGANTFPKSLSRERLPRELLDVDQRDYTVCLEWDMRHRGVHIYLTPKDGSVREDWWYDWATQSFWTDLFATANHQPHATLAFKSRDPEASCVLLGGGDGYVRRYRDRAETDDGTEITSYVLLGPMMLWDDLHDGLLQQCDATLGAQGGQVTLGVYVASTAEGVVTATVRTTKTLSAGRNNTWRPRVGGAAYMFRLENAETDRAWAFENMAVVLKQGGRHRE